MKSQKIPISSPKLASPVMLGLAPPRAPGSPELRDLAQRFHGQHPHQRPELRAAAHLGQPRAIGVGVTR